MTPEFYNTLREYCADEQAVKALGSAMLQCNAVIVPEAMPEIAVMIPNFQRPIVTNNEKATFNVAGGAQFSIPGAPKNYFEGQWGMIETSSLQITGFAELIQAMGGSTDCIVFDGRRDRYTARHELKNVCITFEPIDIEGEGTSTIQRVQAAVSYNYYGLSAGLGSMNHPGMINGAQDAIEHLLARSNKLLNSVLSGNPILKAITGL